MNAILKIQFPQVWIELWQVVPQFKHQLYSRETNQECQMKNSVKRCQSFIKLKLIAVVKCMSAYREVSWITVY